MSIILAMQVPSLNAQDKNPFANDPQAARLGEFQFRSNCAFCHGLGARGGGRGPDLRRAHKRHGSSDADLARTIREGIPGTAMPAAVGSIGVAMTTEEIWQVVTYIRSIELKAPAEKGDPVHGKQLFNGAASCARCHMISGKGGRLGPDLSGVASARSVDSLIESIRTPSRRLAQGIFEPTKDFAQEYETAKVETSDHQKLIGVVLNEDSFTLQMMDTSEKIYLFEKDKLRSFEKSRESLMPVYDHNMLSEKDLNDILAYLQSVGSDEGGN